MKKNIQSQSVKCKNKVQKKTAIVESPERFPCHVNEGGAAHLTWHVHIRHLSRDNSCVAIAKHLATVPLEH